VIEGFEISNPDGPGIRIRDVDYVVIRNNYVHGCGTDFSEAIQANIIAGIADASLAMMNMFMETGGILVFNAKRVEVYGNRVSDNDYGIAVTTYQTRTDEVLIYNNTVERNHRSYFISVYDANKVDIYNNFVADNGLSIFMDNIALVEAFERGEAFGDGRSQGILSQGSNHVRIHGNTVINSSSDGIGVINGELDYVEDVEIFDNMITGNGEQGIWIVKSRNGWIHDNVIWENRIRPGDWGGSSGIMFEGGVSNFSIYDNDISYNDALGIFAISSSDNDIYGNEIHHNADGAIGFGESFFIESSVSNNTIIRDNIIHHNRIAAFNIRTDLLANVVVDNNTFTKNGGNPIHYADYDDYDVTAHPEDWEYDSPSVLTFLRQDEQLDDFTIGTNIIDGIVVTGSFEWEPEPEPEEGEQPQEPPTEESVTTPEQPTEETPEPPEPSTEETETPPETPTGETQQPIEPTVEEPETLPESMDEEQGDKSLRLDEILIPAGILVVLATAGMYVYSRLKRGM